MKFNKLVSSIMTQFAQKDGHLVVPFITGCPGGGKSACAREIARQLQEKYDIPDERVIEFNPSLRDPVDIMGLPFRSEDGTHSEWLPPEEFYAIRKGQGASILILEEMSDAQMNMQNPLCRVILDRYAGQMPLSEQLFIICTGNRQEDKSGASRLSTKLGNRVRNLEFTSSVDDWVAWAITKGISSNLIGFIRFRPALLSDFDPKRTVNPTPRSWEDVSRVPESLCSEDFFEHIKGAVGEGAAAEYTGFLKVAKDMPDPQEVLKHPETAPVPSKPDVCYAILAAMETRYTPKLSSNIVKYVMRFPSEFQAMFFSGLWYRDNSIINDAGWRAWAVKNGDILNALGV